MSICIPAGFGWFHAFLPPLVGRTPDFPGSGKITFFACKKQLYCNLTIKIDIKKAFDRTRRSVVMRALLNVPGLDERIVYALFREWAAPAVLPSTSGELATRPVDMQVGLRQGGSDSSLAFVVAIDSALKHAVRKWDSLHSGPGIPEVPHAHHYLFVDDLIIASNSVN